MSLTDVSWGPRTGLRPDTPGAGPSSDTRPGAPLPGRPSTPAVRRQRPVRWVVGIVVAAALVTGTVSDLQVRSQLRQTRSSLRSAQDRLAATQSRLAMTLATLRSVETGLGTATDQRDALQVELRITAWELSGAETNLASTQTSLANANTGLSLKAAAIATLNTCLGGVETALNQISVGDQGGAVSSISAVAGSCQSIQGQGKGGPVFPFDFPDPDVIRVGSVYYGYATNSATGNVQMIRSTDLQQWTVLGDALSGLPPWARHGDTWAPGVIALGGTFVLYYTAFDTATKTQCISLAVAAGPQGPFVDRSTTPLVCQSDRGGSIDPSPYVDGRGTPYLTWKSEGWKGRPATIWAQRLSADGTALAGPGPTALLVPSQAWEAGVVEGPFMLPWSGRYYLFYSANDWRTADYAIGVAECQGPTGPCSKPLDHAVVGSDADMAGPGGATLFTDTQGGLWMAFHAWLPSAVDYPHNRLLFLRQVTFADRLPVVQPPS